MIQASPLRYPGGKASMAGLIAETRRLNGLGGLPLAEAFAGGAGAALQLLYREETSAIHINDADPSVFAFWWAATQRHSELALMLRKKRVSMAEWRRQREIYRNPASSQLKRAFATFYLNRTNRSGIIATGGPIGGHKQQGEWKLGARFNKRELATRLARVAEYAPRIRVSGLDGIRFIQSPAMRSAMLFIDPPYYVKGSSLYLNGLTHEYHESLATLLRSRESTSWLLTYDDCPEIRRLYAGWAQVRPFKLRYTASERRRGAELLIAPRSLRLPLEQASSAIDW